MTLVLSGWWKSGANAPRTTGRMHSLKLHCHRDALPPVAAKEAVIPLNACVLVTVE
jgi:hypothetical protein